MKLDPTAWLRTMARRQKPATGGYIPADTPMPITGCDYAAPAVPAKREPPPGVTVTFHPDSTPTPELIQQMAEALGAGTAKTAELPQRTKPSLEHTAEITRQANEAARREHIDTNCPCIAIYSRCRCPH